MWFLGVKSEKKRSALFTLLSSPSISFPFRYLSHQSVSCLSRVIPGLITLYLAGSEVLIRSLLPPGISTWRPMRLGRPLVDGVYDYPFSQTSNHSWRPHELGPPKQPSLFSETPPPLASLPMGLRGSVSWVYTPLFTDIRCTCTAHFFSHLSRVYASCTPTGAGPHQCTLQSD